MCLSTQCWVDPGGGSHVPAAEMLRLRTLAPCPRGETRFPFSWGKPEACHCQRTWELEVRLDKDLSNSVPKGPDHGARPPGASEHAGRFLLHQYLLWSTFSLSTISVSLLHLLDNR